MNSITMLDDLTFEDRIQAENDLVLVNFSADWCGPCKIMAPILKDMSSAEKVKLFRVNVDASPEITHKFEIRDIPTVVFFKNGTKVHESLGLKSIEELREEVELYK